MNLNFTYVEPTFRAGYEEKKAENTARRLASNVRGVTIEPTWCNGCAMVVDSDHPHLWMVA